jgi:hypothetical protein
MKIDDANLPPELMKFQHLSYSAKNWKAKLARSLIYKFQVLGSEPPYALANYASSVGSLSGNEPQDLRTLPESPLKELLEIADSRGTRTNLWNLYSQYNFDLEKITFNFSPATIPGYGWAAGDRIVRVPWDGLTGYLDVRLKEGPIGTLLSARKAAGRAPP